MEWTEETISHLRDLWQEGLSTAEIGRRLSVTKNAVVGKAHRLVLPPRQSPIKKPSDATKSLRERAPRRDAPAPLASSDDASAATPPPLKSLAEPDQGKLDAHDPVQVAVEQRPEATEPPPVTATITPLRLVKALPIEPAAREAGPSPSGRRGQSCCWPLGDPGTKQFRFCGAAPMQGKPYCSEHAQLAYIKLRDRRDTVA